MVNRLQYPALAYKYQIYTGHIVDSHLSLYSFLVGKDLYHIQHGIWYIRDHGTQTEDDFRNCL